MEVMMYSSLLIYGLALWYDEEEIGTIGVRAAGVKGINLKEEDYVIGVKVLAKDSDEMIAIVTQRGAVKKMKLTEFEKTSRAKRGVVVLRELKAHPHRVIGFEIVKNTDQLFILSEKGHRRKYGSGDTQKFRSIYKWFFYL